MTNYFLWPTGRYGGRKCTKCGQPAAVNVHFNPLNPEECQLHSGQEITFFLCENCCVAGFVLHHYEKGFTEWMENDGKKRPKRPFNRRQHVARALASLREQIDHRRLSVGLVCKSYNDRVDEGRKITCRRCGSLLREYGLTVPAVRYRANGKSGVHCLICDKATELFIKDEL